MTTYDDEVFVDVNEEQRVREAEANGRAYALEVMGQCLVAGYPEMAADLIRERMSLPDVRNRLQKRQAADDATVKHESPDVEMERAALERFNAQAGAQTNRVLLHAPRQPVHREDGN